MPHSTATLRRACAIGATIAVIGLSTGFGALSASAAELPEAAPATASAGSAAAPTEDTAPGTGTDFGTGTGTGTGTDEETAAASPDATTPVVPVPDAAEDTEVPADETTAPSSAPAAPATSAPAVADPTATIAGDATVGSTLTATGTGFTGTLSYVWTGDGTTLPVTTESYLVLPSDAGKVIAVTITGDDDQTATASTAAVTQAASFPEATTEDEPVMLSTTAGERFTHTFAADGFPKPTYSVEYFSLDDPYADETDQDESGYLPYGLSLDHSTGVLSGTSDYSGTYAFRIVATSGTTTASQYVNLTTDASTPLGVRVTAEDKDTFLTAHSTSWVIERDGTVWTFQNETTPEPDGGYSTLGVGFEGGQPTIDQGGTLLVGGSLVDRFGNEVDGADGYPAPFTVTSDHTSDVIVPNTDPWAGAEVTFPHASTHALTVASSSFATAFTVDVRPTASTVATPVAPTSAVSAAVPTGQLAYTGSDAMHLLPWAAGLALTGVGVIALQARRRKRS
ncbi:putative Ig domain-containing protein [Curtobacterium sp. MCLR17_040]|uniref:putative Ig domain-containing protein n=1 Tax=Curtobacterium sp. MCLR17_040 TaxID=2175625 RepID=UPI0015E8B7B1|nr:putative Ig domain-containing protein [Curtobacterium sp. MCLR17_040]